MKEKLISKPAIRTSMSRWMRTPTANRAGGQDEDHEIAPAAKDDDSPVTKPSPVTGGCRLGGHADAEHMRGDGAGPPVGETSSLGPPSQPRGRGPRRVRLLAYTVVLPVSEATCCS